MNTATVKMHKYEIIGLITSDYLDVLLHFILTNANVARGNVDIYRTSE